MKYVNEISRGPCEKSTHAGLMQGSNECARPPTRLESLEVQLGQLEAGAHEMFCRAQSIATRLIGPIPQSNDKSCDSCDADPALVRRLEDRIANIGTLFSRISDELSRLESL